MKKLKYSLLAFVLFTMGCNILEKEPLDIISDAVVWKDEALVDAYLADLYDRTDFIERRGSGGQSIDCVSLGLIGSLGGEIRSYGGHHIPYKAATEVITGEGFYNILTIWKYSAIRDINYFIEKLETESTLEQAVIDQYIAEARFLRAYLYFEHVKRYGGIPILTKAQDMDAPLEELYVPRDSEKDVYDFIISETDALADILPSEPEQKGRPSKWAALALQSRSALYAASIARYGTVQLDGLLGFPASDENYYAQISYDASTAIINNGIHELYEQYADPVENFQNLFLDESDANKEVIMAEVYDYSLNRAHAFTQRAMPHEFSSTWGAWHFLYDWVERFEFADGSPGTSISRTDLESREWTPEELFHNRDPRFRATVFYPESPWQGGKVYFHSSTIRDGVTYSSGVAEDGWPYAAHTRNQAKSGFMVRKRCNESKIMPTNVVDDDTDYIIFRLGEIYLNLAEAAFYLDLPGEALDALNRIRQRADMPDKETINEEIIQNERLVELTEENQSYWDIRRWRIAQEWLDGKRMAGLKYKYNYDTKKYQITVVNAEGVARTFQERNYYLPLGVDRVSENPNFVENPGY